MALDAILKVDGEQIFPRTMTDLIHDPISKETLDVRLQRMDKEKVIISQSDYDNLLDKDPDKYYYIYEEE